MRAIRYEYLFFLFIPLKNYNHNFIRVSNNLNKPNEVIKMSNWKKIGYLKRK